MNLHWTWRRFPELGVEDLYEALALRCRVFTVEQHCAFQDPDGADRDCWHLIGKDAAGVVLAYLRVVDAGVKYTEVSIGRVVNAPEARGTGVGRALMAEGLRRTAQVWPGHAVRIGAQSRLRRFYESFGFVVAGDEYIEDDIPHIEMLRPAMESVT